MKEFVFCLQTLQPWNFWRETLAQKNHFFLGKTGIVIDRISKQEQMNPFCCEHCQGQQPSSSNEGEKLQTSKSCFLQEEVFGFSPDFGLIDSDDTRIHDSSFIAYKLSCPFCNISCFFPCESCGKTISATDSNDLKEFSEIKNKDVIFCGYCGFPNICKHDIRQILFFSDEKPEYSLQFLNSSSTQETKSSTSLLPALFCSFKYNRRRFLQLLTIDEVRRIQKSSIQNFEFQKKFESKTENSNINNENPDFHQDFAQNENDNMILEEDHQNKNSKSQNWSLVQGNEQYKITKQEKINELKKKVAALDEIFQKFTSSQQKSQKSLKKSKSKPENPKDKPKTEANGHENEEIQDYIQAIEQSFNSVEQFLQEKKRLMFLIRLEEVQQKNFDAMRSKDDVHLENEQFFLKDEFSEKGLEVLSNSFFKFSKKISKFFFFRRFFLFIQMKIRRYLKTKSFSHYCNNSHRTIMKYQKGNQKSYISS